MGDIGYQGYGVGDETCFCGNMRRIDEGRQTKAPVVAGQEVSFWDARDGAVG